MTRLALLSLVVLTLTAAARADGPPPGRERLSMDAHWRFHLDDPAEVKPGLFAYPEQKDLAKASADDFQVKRRPGQAAGRPGQDRSRRRPADRVGRLR